MTRNNIVYLVLGALIVAVVVLGYQLYQERRQPEGVQIKIGPGGVSIEHTMWLDQDRRPHAWRAAGVVSALAQRNAKQRESVEISRVELDWEEIDEDVSMRTAGGTRGHSSPPGARDIGLRGAPKLPLAWRKAD